MMTYCRLILQIEGCPVEEWNANASDTLCFSYEQRCVLVGHLHRIEYRRSVQQKPSAQCVKLSAEGHLKLICYILFQLQWPRLK